MDDTRALLQAIATNWSDVQAMTPPRAPHIILDVVLSTQKGEIRITGRAISAPGELDESFCLAFYNHVKSGWWKEDSQHRTKWQPRPLANEWASTPLRCILDTPRTTKIYSEHRYDLHTTPKSEVECFKAISFEKTSNEFENVRIVISASDSNPCALEIATTPTECDELVSRLELVQEI